MGSRCAVTFANAEFNLVHSPNAVKIQPTFDCWSIGKLNRLNYVSVRPSRQSSTEPARFDQALTVQRFNALR